MVALKVILFYDHLLRNLWPFGNLGLCFEKGCSHSTKMYWKHTIFQVQFSSVQSLSCVQLFVTPWIAACQASLSITNSQSSLIEFTHRVGDAIQPSHPLLSPSPPAPNPSQHLGLFQLINSPHEVAKVLEFQLQHQPFQWTPGTYLLQDGLVGSPCSPRDSQESSPTPQFKASILQCSAFFIV